MKIALIIFTLFFVCCKSLSEKDFDAENEKIKTEFKIEHLKFVEKNANKLSDEEMVKSLDSLTEEYIINKNKKLAVKFIKTKSGIKRLNFLKAYFGKQELQNLLYKVPRTMKTDTNYIAIVKYAEK